MLDATGEASANLGKNTSDVRLPNPASLQKLSEADQQTIQRLVCEPFEYIHHPSFSTKSTKTLPDNFGDVVSTAPWCNAAGQQKNPRFSAGTKRTSLSGDQERDLFLTLNYARFRIDGIFKQFTGKTLTANAVKEILAWHRKSEDARTQLVQANVALVLAMAKRTRLGNLDYAELISEGNMALLRSVDKFDCGRGFKFSTYACRAILKSFSRVAMKVGRYRGRFPVEFDPTLEKSDFTELQRLDHEADCVSELRGIIEDNSAELNEVETKVIAARFALNIGANQIMAEPQTLEQVGLLIGVTKERVRQIQNRALAKLREKLNKDFLAA